MLDFQRSVADLVLDHSACAQVFQRHRIDFCCRGDLSIQAASEKAGIDPALLMAELSRAIAGGDTPDEARVRQLPTAELIELVVEAYHVPLREVLPFVRGLATKVARVHGDHNPSLGDLEVAVAALCDTLLPHIDAEEKELFPMMRDGGTPERVAAELDGMKEEHLEVGRILERIRAAADDFAIPDWACRSYRALFAELERLEDSIHRHVHLENFALEPQVRAGLQAAPAGRGEA